MNITNILSSLTSNDVISEISKKFNIDSSKVSSVISNALPTLIGALQKNASTESGASALAKALGDHASNAGSLISNLKNVDLSDGSKILSKIFGGNLSSVLSGISQKTGTTTNQVSSILSSIAPSLMNILGNLKGSTNGNGLGSLLGTVLGSNASSGLGSLLSDKDGDGKPDILSGLGSLFGK